jgi:mitochondrial chaperone BCS1
MDLLTRYVPGILDSFFRKSFLKQDGKVVTLALASVGPLITSLVWYYSHTVIEVSQDEQVRWVQHWLVQRQDVIRRLRRLVLISAGSMIGSRRPSARSRFRLGDDGDTEEREVGDRFSPPKLVESPASGSTVWTWFEWYPISISYHHTDKMKRLSMVDNGGYKITVWMAPWGVDIAKKILLEGRDLWFAKRSARTEVLTSNSAYARAGLVEFKVITRPSRPLSSVIIQGNIKEQILEDTTRFLGGEQWYINKGIPYRRGYLLYGPPGCG